MKKFGFYIPARIADIKQENDRRVKEILFRPYTKELTERLNSIKKKVEDELSFLPKVLKLPELANLNTYDSVRENLKENDKLFPRSIRKTENGEVELICVQEDNNKKEFFEKHNDLVKNPISFGWNYQNLGDPYDISIEDVVEVLPKNVSHKFKETTEEFFDSYIAQSS